MTHIQKVFIENLRSYRTARGFSQLAFSEKIGLSQNYLNAVENGKNFPSVEVLQRIADTLEILPYEIFLEKPDIRDSKKQDDEIDRQKILSLKQQVCSLFDKVIGE